MKIVPFTEVRLTLTKIINELQETKEPVVLTRFGKPVATLIDYGHYLDLVERFQDAYAIPDGGLQTS